MNNSDTNTLNNSDKDIIICPKCSECSPAKNSILNFNKNNPDEFEKIICKKCYFEFCYISCVFCKKKIYMKMHREYPKFN